MKGLFVHILFALAIVALFIAGRLGWGRRLALGFCMLATTVGCGGMAMPGSEKPSLAAQAGKTDPLKIGKAWQEYAAEALTVDQMTAGKFDRDAYNKESNTLASKAQALRDAVAGRSQAERNAVDLLTGMYQSLLFDWYATNSMITCYSPVPSPTEPMEIARGNLNSRIISLHNQFTQGKLDHAAYTQALQSMLPETVGGLDKETQDTLKALLTDINS
jgi:hypothetical protein